MIRRVLPLLVLSASLAGCKQVAGPLEARNKPRADAPGLSIEDQERRGRDKYVTFEDDPRIAPPSGISRPGPTGR
ncbi:hypothetical protein [Limnoglobus roseus]|uniref:Uncharacterized protein n=1 Tax=Limnoglobus roseus TaxID=2598579 RepID=A0A5C1A9S3_9BACT|nr:hypothetical protein [Limnoglobus roseus]QEL15951.1 hypothetical protein PX52LOC_02888 [Limnoglobus roseus]